MEITINKKCIVLPLFFLFLKKKTLANQHVLTDEVPILSLTVGAQIPHNTRWVHEKGRIGGLFRAALANIPTFSHPFPISLSFSQFVTKMWGLCGAAIVGQLWLIWQVACAMCFLPRLELSLTLLPPASSPFFLLPPSLCRQYGTLPLFSSLWLNPAPCSTSPSHQISYLCFSPGLGGLGGVVAPKWCKKRLNPVFNCLSCLEKSENAICHALVW